MNELLVFVKDASNRNPLILRYINEIFEEKDVYGEVYSLVKENKPSKDLIDFHILLWYITTRIISDNSTEMRKKECIFNQTQQITNDFLHNVSNKGKIDLKLQFALQDKSSLDIYAKIISFLAAISSYFYFKSSKLAFSTLIFTFLSTIFENVGLHDLTTSLPKLR